MRVLVACEESQRVCTAFRNLGHEAYSCDIIKPSGGHPEWHILCDATTILNPDIDGITFKTMDDAVHSIDRWDMIIAHPPCTYLSNAGACRLYPSKGQIDADRFRKGMEARRFFMSFYDADCERICIENPIPSRVFNLPRYTQIIQPYEFGEPWSKKTCLWLKGLQRLTPTNIIKDYKPYISCYTSVNKGNHDKAGASRAGGAALVRSKTFYGIAEAFAKQWGGNITERCLDEHTER